MKNSALWGKDIRKSYCPKVIALANIFKAKRHGLNATKLLFHIKSTLTYIKSTNTDSRPSFARTLTLAKVRGNKIVFQCENYLEQCDDIVESLDKDNVKSRYAKCAFVYVKRESQCRSVCVRGRACGGRARG